MSAPRTFTNSADAWQLLKQKAVAIKKTELRGRLAKEILQIKSRKSNQITIPVPLDQQEMYFAKLENEGMWKLVLQNLTSLSDITSASSVCDLFRGHLEKRRKLMLLPQVNKLITRKWDAKQSSYNAIFVTLDLFRYLASFGTINTSTTPIPKGMQHATTETNNDALNLRLVSKAWKEAAEEQFIAPTGFFHFQSDWHLLEGTMCMTSPLKCTFKIGAETKDLEKAMEALHNSQSCSTLLKVVDIDSEDYGGSIGEDTRRKNFHEKLRMFFDRHGEHVWALRIGHLLDYKCLWMLVLRMPNLKELFLDCYTDSYDRRWQDAKEKQLIDDYEFPTLPSLKRIVFDNIHQYKLLKTEILKSNPSLKTVTIASENPDYLKEFLPTLENLPLECLAFCTFGEDARMSLHDIDPLRGMNWPLKVLRLTRWHSSYDLPTVNGGDLLRIISRFNATLNEINLDAIVLNEVDGNVVVDFPSLRIINFK